MKNAQISPLFRTTVHFAQRQETHKTTALMIMHLGPQSVHTNVTSIALYSGKQTSVV
jgi:hypothetical protein